MTDAAKGRISDTLVNAFKAFVNPWSLDRETGRYRMRPEAVVALDALPDDDACLAKLPQFATLAVLRTLGRRKQTRRALARASEDERRLFERARAAADQITGRTRPISPLSLLCVALREHAGLTDTEIVQVLDANDIENLGDPEEARGRVRKRITRAKARQKLSV